MIKIHKLKQLMESKGIAKSEECVGVSMQEIHTLENYFGIAFPQAYCSYLKHFGRSAGYLSPWMAIYFDDLKEIQEYFKQAVAKANKPFSIPSNSLFIANWESVFDFMVCDGSEDPEVFRIDTDESTEALSHAPSFSKYLENLISQHGDEIPIDDIALDERYIPSGDTIQF